MWNRLSNVLLLECIFIVWLNWHLGEWLGFQRALDTFVSKENKKLGHMHLVIGHHHEIATSSVGLSVIMVPYSRCSRNNPSVESS